MTEAADSPLTTMEERCIRLLFDGLSHAEIAVRLGLSEGTVATYLYHAACKLDLPPGKGRWIYAARRLHLRVCRDCQDVR